MNKCMYCLKDLDNPKAKFCSPSHKMSFRRGSTFKDETVTVIKETVTNNPNNEPIIVTEVKTVTAPQRELVFKDESPEERLKKYNKYYPNSPFVPNWVINGFNSREDAIRVMMKEINSNKSIISTGLHD